MLRAILTKDLGWKLFSVILAVFIWVTVHRILDGPNNAAAGVGGSTVTYDNLQVSVVASSADVHLYRVLPGTVSVTVSGSPEVISVLQANQVSATVNLNELDPAKDLKRRVNVSVPPGITLVSVEPARVGILIPPKP
jgi:YbbR domain-containing protein